MVHSMHVLGAVKRYSFGIVFCKKNSRSSPVVVFSFSRFCDFRFDNISNRIVTNFRQNPSLNACIRVESSSALVSNVIDSIAT